MSKHDFYHLTLTFDLDLQSQPILGQGRPYAKNRQRLIRSHRRAWTNRHADTHIWTDGRYQVHHYLPALLKLSHVIIIYALVIVETKEHDCCRLSKGD